MADETKTIPQAGSQLGDQGGTSPSALPPVAASVVEPVVIDGLSIYPVLSPLRHDGKLYSPDDLDANRIALDPKEAKALQALGVLGEPVTDADVSVATSKPKVKAKK